MYKPYCTVLTLFCIYSTATAQLVTVLGSGTAISQVEKQVGDTIHKRLTLSPVDAVMHTDTLKHMGTKNFYFPVSKDLKITSAFGIRVHPVLGVYRLHSGIDIQAFYEDVYAFTNGMVSETGYDKKAGNYCKINHGDSIESVYAHLSIIIVKPGNWVNGGDVLGLSGASGLVTGPHLHFGIKFKRTPVNPLFVFYSVNEMLRLK